MLLMKQICHFMLLNEKRIFFLSSGEAMGCGVTKTSEFNKRYDKGKTLQIWLLLFAVSLNNIHGKKIP